MKKITFFFLLLTVSLGYAQVNLEGFEGAVPTTTNDQNIANSVEPNPDTANAVNTSATALQLITTTAGEPWQGTKLLMQNNKIDMTTADKTMTVDIYSAAPIEFLFKLSNGDADPAGTDPALESKTAMAHTGSGWETLNLDFNNAADTGQPGYNPPNDQFSAIVFFPLYNIAGNNWNPSAVTTTYVDNVTAVAGDAIVVDTCTNGVMDGDETGVDCGGSCPNACTAEPTGPAPTPPTSNPAGYFSIYSDTYTDQSNVVFGAFNVGAQDITEIEIAPGDNILKVVTTAAPGQNFLFADWGLPEDVSAMTNYHMDYWIDTVFTTGLIMDHKWSNHVGDAGETSSFSATPGVSTFGQWVSVDIPISTMTNGDATQLRNALRQYVLTVAGADLDTRVVYFDNIYLYNNALSTDDFATADFKAFPNPTNGDWNISGSTVINNIAVYDILGKQVITLAPNTNEAVINASALNSGIYFARIEGVNGSKTVKLIKE